MGEAEFEQKPVVKAVDAALVEQGNQASELRVATPGGRFQVRWGNWRSLRSFSTSPGCLSAGFQVGDRKAAMKEYLNGAANSPAHWYQAALIAFREGDYVVGPAKPSDAALAEEIG